MGKAGFQDRITLKIGSTAETLEKLLEENGSGSFDFIFIDNTQWYGKVVDQFDTNEDTIAICQINDFVRDDQCVDISFLRLGVLETEFLVFSP